MKKLIAVLSFLFLLTLCACSTPKESGTPPDTSRPAETDATDGTGEQIMTDYYSITIPSQWLDRCAWVVTRKDDGTDILKLYEKTAYEETGAGKLCSLMLFADTDYRELPDYQLLGTLDTRDGTFCLVAVFPTDVQFTNETMDAYNGLYEELPAVLDTLCPHEGIEMAMPSTG